MTNIHTAIQLFATDEKTQVVNTQFYNGSNYQSQKVSGVFYFSDIHPTVMVYDALMSSGQANVVSGNPSEFGTVYNANGLGLLDANLEPLEDDRAIDFQRLTNAQRQRIVGGLRYYAMRPPVSTQLFDHTVINKDNYGFADASNPNIYWEVIYLGQQSWDNSFDICYIQHYPQQQVPIGSSGGMEVRRSSSVLRAKSTGNYSSVNNNWLPIRSIVYNTLIVTGQSVTQPTVDTGNDTEDDTGNNTTEPTVDMGNDAPIDEGDDDGDYYEPPTQTGNNTTESSTEPAVDTGNETNTSTTPEDNTFLFDPSDILNIFKKPVQEIKKKEKEEKKDTGMLYPLLFIGGLLGLGIIFNKRS